MHGEREAPNRVQTAGRNPPYDNNPRRNDEAAKAVANSIKEFGFQSPIIVDRDGVIIAGHTRYKAARRLKLQEVPVIVAAELDPEKVKALRIADNSTGEVAEWDLQLLVQELTGIDYDMTDFGLNLQIKIDEEVKEDDFSAEPRSSRSPSEETSGCWANTGSCAATAPARRTWSSSWTVSWPTCCSPTRPTT